MRVRGGRMLATLVAGLAALPMLLPVPAVAGPALTIEPISWNVIGLDSNDVTTGPNRFLVGGRVCNEGDEAATGLTTTFAWDSSNPHIDLVGPSSVTDPVLDPGACVDAYFLVTVARDAGAYDTTRSYHLEVASDGGGTASTPSLPLYVERLISQNRNDAISIEGPQTVYVGGTYTYTATSSTAPRGYEQLASFLDWPTTMFRILDIQTTLGHPPGTTIDTTYADACGWDPDTRTCSGTGKAGGDIVTVYTVEVVGAGTATLRNLIYDFSGSSFHYNADYDADVPPLSSSITIEALQPPDLAIAKELEGQLVVGRSGRYALTVTNVGTSTAAETVTVTDELPEWLRFASVDADGWDCGHEDGAVTCTSPGPLEPGQSETLVLTVDVALDAPDTVTNVATVRTTPDADPDNDTATSTDPVGRPGLAVDKRAQPPEGTALAPGERVTYEIEVVNTGDATTTGIVLTDALPAGTVPVSATVDGVEVRVEDLASGLAVGDLAAGDRHVATIVVDVLDEGTTELVNAATATADELPPVTDEVRHPVEVTSALSVSKDVSATTAAPGDRLTYTLTVTSDGPHIARDVELTDVTPDGTRYVAGSTTVDGAVHPDGGTNPLDSGLPLGDLAPGRVVSVTFDVTVDPDAAGVLVNVARATATGIEEPSMDDAVTTVGETPDAPSTGELPATGFEERPWAVFWTGLTSILLGLVLLGSVRPVEPTREA